MMNNDSESAPDTQNKELEKTSTKRCMMTLGVKLKLIQEFESGVKHKSLLQKYKIPASTLSTILSNKETYKSQVQDSEYSLSCKRAKKSKYEDIDNSLWQWYKKASLDDDRITPMKLAERAEEIAREMGYNNFRAYSGWIHRFKVRRGIGKLVSRKVEASTPPEGVVSPELLSQWTNDIVPSVLRKYEPQNIFTVQETAFFYRVLPQDMLPYVDERCNGGRHVKERLSVMFACNMTGTEKLPLLVVGKYQRPGSLKHVQTLPTEYVVNRKAWIIPAIFEEWLKRFDSVMESSWRRVALCLTSSASHPHVEGLKAVSLVFLPPERQLQPAHQGILQTFRLNYKQVFLEHLLDRSVDVSCKNPRVSLLDSLLWLREAWKRVSSRHITAGFREAGVVNNRGGGGEVDGARDGSESEAAALRSTYLALFDRVVNTHVCDQRITADAFLDVDKHLATHGVASSCEALLMQTEALEPRRVENVLNDGGEDLGDEEIEEAVTPAEARKSLQILHKFFTASTGLQDDGPPSGLDDLEQAVRKLTNSPAKQTTMLDYFTKRSDRQARVPKPVKSFYFPRC